ncbi:nuclear transport factor 2 family protein [Streptococcus dentiloxodontae]
MNILNRYFYLSDLAVQNENSLQELIQLFAEDAVIEANDSLTYTGKEEIIPFFKDFFSRNLATKHLWDVHSRGNGKFQANWAVAGRRNSGDYFALTGQDIATVKNDRITHLKIIGN